MKFNFYLLLAIITLGQAQDCSNIRNDYLTIVSQESEVLKYPLSDIFNNPEQEYIKIGTQDQVKLVSSIAYLDFDNYVSRQINNIISVKTLRDTVTYQSTGKYLAFDQFDPNYALYYSSISSQANWLPNINGFTRRDSDPLICFDADFIDSSTKIIDCAQLPVQGVPQANLMIIQGDQYDEIQNDNNGNYESTTQRLLRTNGNIIYRGTPYTGIGTTEKSIIEVLRLENNAITTVMVLTEDIVKEKAQIENFQLIDFRLGPNNNISLLNKDGWILHMEVDLNNQQWKLIRSKFIDDQNLVGFDYNFYNQNYVAISPNALYTMAFTHQFATPLVNAQAKYSKNYIIAYDSTVLYQFSSTEDIIISQMTLDSYYLIYTDIMQDDFVIFFKANFKRYLLNKEAYIEYSNKAISAQKETTLTYEKPGTPKCEVKIKYLTVEQNSGEIIPIQEPTQFITDGVIATYGKLFYRSLNYHYTFAGKYLQYIPDEDSKISIQFYGQYSSQEIKNIDYTQDIIYTQVFRTVGGYNYLLQQQNKKLTYLFCKSETTSFGCTQLIQTELTENLDQRNSVSIKKDNAVDLYYISNEGKQITYITITDTQVSNPLNFGVITEGKYTQLSEGVEVIISLNADQNTISFFNQVTGTQIGQIDQQSMENKGVKNFMATSIQSIPIQQLLAISSTDYVYFLSYQTNRYGYVVYLSEKYGVTESIRQLVIVKDQFIVADRVTNNVLVLQVYNIENLVSIYKQRRIQINQVTEDMQIVPIYTKKLLYIKGYDNFNQPQIFVLQLGEISQNIPYITVPIGKNPNIAAMDDNIFVYANQSYQLYYISLQMRAYACANKYVTDYVTMDNIQMKITNKVSEYTYTQPIKIINTNYLISMDMVKINLEMLNLQFQQENSYTTKCYDQKQWISGQIITTEIECDQCDNNQITLSQPIEITQDKSLSQGRQIIEFNEKQFIILYESYFYLIQKEDFEKNVKFDFGNTMTCYNVIVTEESLLFGCTQGVNQLVVRYKCITNVCLENKRLTITNSADKGLSLIDNYLFTATSTIVTVYYLPEGLDQLDEGQKIVEINQDLVQMVSVGISHNQYLIYTLQEMQYLVEFSYTFTDDVAELQSTKSYILETYLNTSDNRDAKGYIAEDTKYTGLWIVKQSTDYYQLLLSTSNVAQYILTVELNCQDQGCQIKQVWNEVILSQYGEYTLNKQPYVSIKDNFISLAYERSYGMERQVVIYELPPKATDTTPLFVSLLGGSQGTSTNNNNQMLVYSYDEQYYLLAPTDLGRTFTKHTINNELNLCFTGHINNQDLKITSANDFTSNYRSLLLKESNLDEKSSLLWLWIVLGIVGVLAVGGGAFYCIKKSKTKTRDSLL